ncbi:uncharacterized protein [Watersipora subatra]|uniref:uncharacterized protein n=1 Tax=Watersipora subatra TaxID=2589382 RepID=UPI00355C9BEF
MSGNPKPKGREFNPRARLAGTQVHHMVNGSFAAIVVTTLAFGYWFITSGAERLGFDRTPKRNNWPLEDPEAKITQARIKRIRELKLAEKDPYYKDAEKKTTLSAEQK